MPDMGVLIVGHMIGDYLLQNDWMANNKTRSHWICALHAALWTLAVCACGFIWEYWAWAWLFGTHWVIDRFGLASRFMRVAGQREFLETLSPWSRIVVDNSWHLVTILAMYFALAYARGLTG